MLVLFSALALAFPVSDPLLQAPSALSLPPVRGPLVFEAGTDEVSLDQLLLSLAELTGQELALTPLGRQALQQAQEPLESAAPVPAAEVYTFVEGLLARHGVLIAPVTGGSRPILGVQGFPNSREGSILEPLAVDLTLLPELASHPALYVRFLVHFRHSDSRQIQTQLRQLLVDPSGMNYCLPVGELSLLLQGRASEMASLARLLLEADEYAGRTRPAAVPPAAAPKAEGEGPK